jgi:Tfp pilus assembly protein PilF
MSASSAEALALLRQGRAAEAEALLRKRLAGGSADARSVHLLGFILATGGRVDEGLPFLDRSLAMDPRNPDFLGNRAQVLAAAGRFDEAARDAAAATAQDPSMGQAWIVLAQALRRLGRREESRTAAKSALANPRQAAAAAYHIALLDMEAGDAAAAEAGFAAVVQREPQHAAALNNLGILQRDGGRNEVAVESFRRAAQAAPGDAGIRHNLGVALRGLGRLEEAYAAFAAGQSPESLANAAGLAMELERLGEARELYARAAALRPGFADAEYGLAQVALREHRFAPGWDGYERRFDTTPPLALAAALPLPRLEAGDLARARRVAVTQEQGLGDQVLFSTLLPELARRGIDAIVEIDARLHGLYRRSLPGFTFTRPGDEAAFAGCDFQVPLGSLARLFRRDVAAFAAQPSALLVADPARVEALRAAVRALAPEGDVVAISWRSPQAGERRWLGERKSIALARLAEAAAGERLLDLQYGEVDAERRDFEARNPGRLLRIPGLDLREDLEGVAAALVACGRLVTVSNATAHLAGALGVDAELLIPRGWPPFSYWAPAENGRSLWYPSVRIVAHPG